VRRILSVMLLLLILVPCHAAQDATDFTPQSETASATLDIAGPDGPIDPDEEVYLRIHGLTLAEVEEAQDAHLFDLTAFPLGGVKIKASYDWMFRTLDLEFRAKHAGQYLVKLHLVRDGELEIAAIVVTVDGDAPDPNPPPPPPDPDPEPEPGGPWQILMFHESSQLPRLPMEQRFILVSSNIQTELASRGHALLGIFDVDSSGSDGSHGKYADWWRAVDGDPLPRIALAPLDGGDISDCPLPANKEELWALLKGGVQ